MILTYKQSHNKNFGLEIGKAKQTAEFGIKNRCLSSKNVKHFGLKSIISNQILRKYVKDKKCKKITSVNLIIPNQGIKYNSVLQEIKIPSLKFIFKFIPRQPIEKINQIEISKDTIFISCYVKEAPEIYSHNNFIGIDLNSTGHLAVVANPQTGKILKLGKKAWHIRKKYSNLRKKFQSKKKYRKLKQIKNKESRIIKDLNHKISRKIVNYAYENQTGIRLENLTGIRKNKKGKKMLSYNLNSWSFYQLRQFIDYKAKLLGIPVSYVAPCYTSQICSRSGLMGERNKDIFKSPIYGVESSHVNAAFNIALAQNGDSIVNRKRCSQRESDTPKEALVYKSDQL